MIYLDSSVALTYLLAEDRFPPDELWDEQLVSSRLLECEIWNRINARRLQRSHGDAPCNLIGRVAMIEWLDPCSNARCNHSPLLCGHWTRFTSRRWSLSARKSRTSTRQLR